MIDNSHTFTADYCGDYFHFTNDTKLKLWASEGWTNYQADEMVMSGWYDFTLRMHPVPPGTYEIRLGYRAETWRGVAQLFIDDEIVGIPVESSYYYRYVYFPRLCSALFQSEECGS